MTHPNCPAGFRVVGDKHGVRELVNAPAAFSGYCNADPALNPDRECYLSAFRYGRDFPDHLTSKNGSTKGFAGECWSPWLWFDIDREDDLHTAHADTKKLVGFLLEQYRSQDEEDILVFFSGAKGFHVGLPLPHAPAPSADFHRVCRELAVGLAAAARVRIDTAIYDKVRLFRAPNSRHQNTGLYKRRLTHDELMRLSIDGIRELAREPLGFDVPYPTAADEQLRTDWDAAVERAASVRTAPAAASDGTPRLNRATRDFIREGAPKGERNKSLFAAAANLREFPSVEELIHALLTEPALDSGLPPAEIRRAIDNAIGHVDSKGGPK